IKKNKIKKIGKKGKIKIILKINSSIKKRLFLNQSKKYFRQEKLLLLYCESLINACKFMQNNTPLKRNEQFICRVLADLLDIIKKHYKSTSHFKKYKSQIN
ncbi:hypothetical protein BpHYR1_046119, partial [Brachionus plicatilis]